MRRGIGALVTSSILVALFAGCGSGLADRVQPPWQLRTEQEVPENYDGENWGFGLSPDGQLHLAYPDRQERLQHLRVDGPVWEATVVDQDLGSSQINPDLALDSNGTPHITYFDNTTESLKLATHRDGAWEVTKIASKLGGHTNFVHSAVAIDQGGRPHVVYNRDKGPVYYAKWDGAAWQVTNVVGDIGEMVSLELTLDEDDVPHIAFIGRKTMSRGTDEARQLLDAYIKLHTGGAPGELIQFTLAYVTVEGEGQAFLKEDLAAGIFLRNSTTQVMEALEGTVGNTSVSLVLDAQGRPNIAYGSLGRGVHHIALDGVTWNASVVAPAGNAGLAGEAAVVIDDNNALRVLIRAEEGLTVATRVASGWERSVVMHRAPGSHQSLALDGSGQLWIVCLGAFHAAVLGPPIAP